MHVYYTPKARITGPKICVWASSSIISLFSKRWMTRKKEAESGFAALTSILPVETQWGAWGILQKTWSVGAHSRIGKAG